MYTVMKHRQVVFLICGLMSDPTPMIHFVYEQWVWDGQKSAGKTQIESMFREAGLPVPRHLLHNEWINYYDHSEGLIKDTTPVYVPSRWYWFDNMKAKLSCNIQHRDTEIPECTMSIIGPYPSVTENLLSICHRICQHQAVRDLYILDVKCKDLPEPHVFTLSKNTESIKINWVKLPTETMSHLMQQINQCSALRVLDLSETTLTGCLSGFLPDPHPGLPELQMLDLRCTALNKDDLHRLLSIAYKLPKLQKLDLSHNTLTGCVSRFLSDPHPGLPELERLDLRYTAFNRDDLTYLTQLIKTQKLPALKILDLEGNWLLGTDVEHLNEACVNHHQWELKLRLYNINLSGTFKEIWKPGCGGTKIEL